MLKNFLQVKKLSQKYNIPKEDILLIALNCCGINAKISENRIRFKFKLNTCKKYFI